MRLARIVKAEADLLCQGWACCKPTSQMTDDLFKGMGKPSEIEKR